MRADGASVGRAGRRRGPASPVPGATGRQGCRSRSRSPCAVVPPPSTVERRAAKSSVSAAGRAGRRRGLRAGPSRLVGTDRHRSAGWSVCGPAVGRPAGAVPASGTTGESRSGRTGRPCYLRTRPAPEWFRRDAYTLRTDLHPFAGRNRDRTLADRTGELSSRVTDRSRAPARGGHWAPTVPASARDGHRHRRSCQAETGSATGSTSVQDEPSSAERATASSTSWTWRASAKDGVGSVPLATASRKSRISWVNECS